MPIPPNIPINFEYERRSIAAFILAGRWKFEDFSWTPGDELFARMQDALSPENRFSGEAEFGIFMNELVDSGILLESDGRSTTKPLKDCLFNLALWLIELSEFWGRRGPLMRQKGTKKGKTS